MKTCLRVGRLREQLVTRIVSSHHLTSNIVIFTVYSLKYTIHSVEEKCSILHYILG